MVSIENKTKEIHLQIIIHLYHIAITYTPPSCQHRKFVIKHVVASYLPEITRTRNHQPLLPWGLELVRDESRIKLNTSFDEPMESLENQIRC